MKALPAGGAGAPASLAIADRESDEPAEWTCSSCVARKEPSIPDELQVCAFRFRPSLFVFSCLSPPPFPCCVCLSQKFVALNSLGKSKSTVTPGNELGWSNTPLDPTPEDVALLTEVILTSHRFVKKAVSEVRHARLLRRSCV